jgi:hypothetical protein
MPRPTEALRKTSTHLLAGATLAALLACAPVATASEGGTTHTAPGAIATLVDGIPTTPGSFAKPIYLHYNGSATAQIPTAAGIVGDLEATTNTIGLAFGHTFATPVLGGAHYTIAAAVPYIWLHISGDVNTRIGNLVRHVDNRVSGLGDITLIPMMLAWKSGDWVVGTELPIYAPTGNYQLGRLGNTGLNYWTFDPIVNLTYNDAKKGFSAMLFAGYAMNTENNDTHYKSGDLLHFDGSIQQMFPVGSGFANLGVEGFYFTQATCDSGSGATLGCFKGKTMGVGPVAGYVLPLSKTETLLFELKWLAETDTKKRLDGDYIWFKVVYKF